MKDVMIKRLKRDLTFSGKRVGGIFSFVAWSIVWVLIFYILLGIFGWMFSKVFGNKILLTNNEFILLITAAIVLFYTFETNQTKKEIAAQNETEQRPVLVLQITTKQDTGVGGDYLITHRVDDAIKPSTYAFTIRNVGKGPAMNVRVSNKHFEVEKYQERFIIPMEGGYAIAIAKKRTDGVKKSDGTDSLAKIRNLDEFNGEVFSVGCDSLSGKEYFFDYKIKDLKKKQVEFIGMDRI